MLSGIDPVDELAKCIISPIADLPVESNLQNHQLRPIRYLTNE